jgi:bifunctional non-homologous end joining protein LigD
VVSQETTSFPEWIVPMAATLTQQRFSGTEWIFQRKFDGIRLAFKKGGDVKLYSRNRLPQHRPAVAEAIAKLPVHDVILDGEAAWDEASKVGYHVFDILWFDGRSVMSLPLDERRALLNQIPLRAPLAHVAEITGDKPWERACSDGWEGVIVKRRTSLYEHRRSPHWLKMKCEASQELVVGGFTDPQSSRVGLGALLVGYFDRDDFVLNSWAAGP